MNRANTGGVQRPELGQPIFGVDSLGDFEASSHFAANSIAHFTRGAFGKRNGNQLMELGVASSRPKVREEAFGQYERFSAACPRGQCDRHTAAFDCRSLLFGYCAGVACGGHFLFSARI